jgi:predicted N-acyltransferase
MNVIRIMEDLDLPRWDGLQPSGGFYATSPWLRHAERTARVAPYYLTGADVDWAMPAYPLDRGDPFVFCRADYVLEQVTGKAPPPDWVTPVLACGARNPGYTFIASRPASGGAATGDARAREVIREAEALAADTGLHAVSYLYVYESDAGLRRELARAGYASFRGKTAFALDVPPTFEEYLSRFSSGRRSAIRRELRQLAEAGVSYRVEPLTPDLAARLAPLEVQLYERYGTPGSEGTLGAIMASIATNLGGHVEVVLAELAGAVCGFTVVLSGGTDGTGGSELYARQTGYDYGMKGGLPVYFAIVYYELVRLAQRRGIKTVYYGTGADETKLSRGCRAIPTTAWVKSLNPAARDGLARLSA